VYYLNQGTIKWKVPLGEDPGATALRIHNIGIPMYQFNGRQYLGNQRFNSVGAARGLSNASQQSEAADAPQRGYFACALLEK
jgi:hypothetical protein